MRNTYIENFTEENGLKVKHSTIIRGISRAVQVVKTNDLVRKLSEKLIK
jgi:peroxiredoxin